MKRFVMVTLLLMFVCPQLSFAGTESAQFPSPNCSKAKIQSLGAGAIVKIHGPIRGDQYIITLDTNKMTFSALTEKMRQAGCF